MTETENTFTSAWFFMYAPVPILGKYNYFSQL